MRIQQLFSEGKKMRSTRNLKTKVVISVFLVMQGLTSVAGGKTIYVDASATGVDKGLRADFQFDIQYPSIQAAIDAAVGGDIIILAPGTFGGDGNRDLDFKGKAITLCSTDPNDPNIVAATIIDCNGSEGHCHRGFYFHSGEDANSVVEGLTITNGFHGRGGGILCIASSPIIRNNIITGNKIEYGADGGGGIGCWDGASPLIVGNIISDNHCEPGGGGGGICCRRASLPTITDNIIAGNSASQGSGILCYGSPTISNCTFIGNTTPGMGGGILIDGSPILTNCTFSGNSAAQGGGMYNYESSPTLTNCRFIANSARYSGGAIYNTRGSSPTLRNCIFTGNIAGNIGGAMYNHGYTSINEPTVVNCTFAANSALHGNALACDSYLQKYPSYLRVANCILWDGGDEVWNNDASTITITYSDVQNACPGEGNIDADPCFADANNGDYHLLPSSPCIDMGDNTVVTATTDLDGNPRIINGIVDMGTYEFQGPRTIYVDADAAGANNGTSWQNAFNYLQDALMFASAGSEVRVAQGIYRPDDFVLSKRPNLGRMESFHLKNGVTIKGGYAGFGQPNPNTRDIELYETILSGDLNGNDVDVNDPHDLFDEPTRTENSYHVVTGSNTDANAILDGFAIAAGNANNGDLYSPHQLGGGMYNDKASPSLIACKFVGNSARAGGGMYNMNSGPTLRNCSFIGNSAHRELYFGGNGGGIYNYLGASNQEVADCVFEGNSATSGSGIMSHSRLIVRDCIFKKNFGDAMWCELAEVKGCIFTSNQGGGIFIGSDSHLSNCLFTGNIGGGLQAQDCDIVIKNCSFIGNITSAFFAGIWNDEGDTTVTNCISWGNIGKDGVTESAQIATNDPAVINYCCIQGWTGALGGTGNTDDDPCFVSEGYWDALPDFNELWPSTGFKMKTSNPYFSPPRTLRS